MAFVRPKADDWKRTMSRVLLSGGPNTGKTTSMRTCKKPVYVISFPGEGGTNSIPQEDGIIPLMWVEEADAKNSSKQVIDEVNAATVEMLTDDKCVTFFGDGIHKLYEYHLDVATAGDYFRGNEFEALLYGRAHIKFMQYIQKVRASAVPYAFFTAWDARDPDKPELKSQSPMHVFPDLPGKLARRIMGEFSIVIASHAVPSMVTGQPPRFFWQLKPSNVVHGAMIKIDERIAAHLPAEVEQNWQKLEAILMEAAEKVKQGVKPTVRTTTKS